MKYYLYDEYGTLLSEEFTSKDDLFAAANDEFDYFLFEQTADGICQILEIASDLFEETQASYPQSKSEEIVDFRFVEAQIFEDARVSGIEETVEFPLVQK